MFKEKSLTRCAVAVALSTLFILCGCAESKEVESASVTESSLVEDISADNESIDLQEEEKPDTLVGRYALYRCGAGDFLIQHEELLLYGLVSSYIEFKEDGTGVLKIGDAKEDFFWEDSGTIFTDHDGFTKFERYGDVIHVTSFENIFTFVRSGVILGPDEIAPITESIRYYTDDSNAGQKAGMIVDEAGYILGYDDALGVYYENSPFYERLSKVTQSGDLREDVVKIALSQVGYHEGNSVEDLCGLNAYGEDDYTEYGRYTKSLGGYWGSEFVSWCVRMTGLPFDGFADSIVAAPAYFTEGTSANYYDWYDLALYDGRYGKYYPQKGDILLVNFDCPSYSYSPYDFQGQSAIITNVSCTKETVTFRVVQGNAQGSVVESDYIFNRATGYIKSDEYTPEYNGMFAYVVSPNYDVTRINYVPYVELSFAANGGYTETLSKKVYPGGLCGALPIPVRAGMTFDGWYTETLGGDKFDIYTPIENDETYITLYAHWK